MRNRSALVLLALSALLWAGEEQDEIAKLIEKYRASRAATLPAMIAELEKTKDQATRKRLLAALAPKHLKPLGDPKMLEAIGLARAMKPALDRYLGGDEKEAKKLTSAMPYAALVVQARIDSEKDAAKRTRLRVLYYRMLDETWERADAIFKSAQGLETVASNHGPFKEKWQSAEVVKLRSRAKVLHWAFVDPKHYGKSLQKNIGMYMPYKDLPAAGQLYRLAQKIYLDRAKAETDEVRAATLKGNAAAAQKAADRCKQSGARAK